MLGRHARPSQMNADGKILFSRRIHLLRLLTRELNLYFLGQLNGETDYEFTDKKAYDDFLERFKKIPEICDSIIYNMRKGMRVKDTIPRLIVLDLLDQYKNTLDLDLEELDFPAHSIKKY